MVEELQVFVVERTDVAITPRKPIARETKLRISLLFATREDDAKKPRKDARPVTKIDGPR
jgi:hypothetical protein